MEDGNEDAGLPVTQSDDPPSGGHFCLSTSKPPPCTATEGSRVKVLVVFPSALNAANSKNGFVGEVSPISNGTFAVGGAHTRLIGYIE